MNTWITNFKNSASISALKTWIGSVNTFASISTLALSIIVAIVTCYLVARFALQTPMSFDTAASLEVAKSIGTNFSYEEIYIPRHVYDPVLTTGGPLLYVGGIAYALTHNIDTALVAGAVSSMVVLLVGLMLLRPWFSVIALVLLFIWPSYSYLSTSFLGELWAAGAVLIGLAAMERITATLTPSNLVSDKRIWLAAAFFGVAIASKLIMAFAILPVAFASAYDQLAPRSWDQIARNLMRSLAVAIVVSVMAGVVFFLQVAFAVLHTVRSLEGLVAAPGIFLNFITDYTGTGTSTPGFELFGHLSGVAQLANFRSHLVLLLIVVAGIVLVISKPSYGLLVLVTSILWLGYGSGPGQWERRMLPMFLIILALGLREMLRLVAQVASRRRLPAPVFEICLVGIIALIVLIANPVIGATADHRADKQRRYAVEVTGGHQYHYGTGLIMKLREQPYVLTSGWYGQFPAISDFWNVQFYDRMAPENAQLRNQDAALLFDSNYHDWPVTSQSGNCASVIYVDGPLVLCRVRKDVPLAYQPAASILPSGWNLTGDMYRASGGPHGATDYEYVGTGVPDNELATRIVPVHPGDVYVFSAWVDPSKIVDGEFDLVIDPPDGRSSYAVVFDPVGSPSRYSTAPWLCPPGVTHVMLGMQLVRTTVANGEKLKFSEPTLMSPARTRESQRP